MFALWCGGAPGVDITARVAHRLTGFVGLPFERALSMLSRATAALRKKKHRDNQLLPLGREFAAPMRTTADAVSLYFHGNGKKDEALQYLRRITERLNGTVRWPASEKHYWGGVLEATCDAARVMLDAHDPLFLPAFRYACGKIVDRMLYSTADTRALVELLAALRYEPAQMARIDDQEVALRGLAFGREVTALSDNLIVRVDRQIEVDHLEPRAGLRFELELSKTRPRLGERIQVKVVPKQESIAPLVRLYLPGCLALLQGGANAQTAHLPVTHQELAVEAIAVRPGHGKLFATVHDMYDADKVGTLPGIDVTVEE
ncbi:MAG TPA: hypothetical protein PKO09_12425 [Anaerolineae bacterium]|nr:hypothetical protein [Anaerolineae bacterium]